MSRLHCVYKWPSHSLWRALVLEILGSQLLDILVSFLAPTQCCTPWTLHPQMAQTLPVHQHCHRRAQDGCWLLRESSLTLPTLLHLHWHSISKLLRQGELMMQQNVVFSLTQPLQLRQLQPHHRLQSGQFLTRILMLWYQILRVKDPVSASILNHSDSLILIHTREEKSTCPDI